MAVSDAVNTPVFLPRYLGSVDFYASIVARNGARMAVDARFDKRRKETHRCVIADTRGSLTLTVPVVKPVSLTNALWSDIIISDHNHWWNLHMTALRSAYGRTPFFEFYEDDFLRIINRTAAGRPLVELDMELDSLMRRLMGIGDVTVTASEGESSYFSREEEAQVVEYYQVRSAELGFIPHLSAVDLLFNMGPESVLVLREMARNITV